MGKDMLYSFDSVLHGGDGTNADARIYPIGEDDRWRVTLEEARTAGKLTVLSTACRTWENVDQVRYGGLPLDEFDFTSGENGITGVFLPGLRARLAKV
jgi:hypothetical protein